MINDNQLAHLSVLASLNKMMTGSHFDICTVDQAIKTLGSMPDGAAYKILRPLHCVHWVDMPRELRDAVPKLIERCISVPAYQFQITDAPTMNRMHMLTAQAAMLTRN